MKDRNLDMLRKEYLDEVVHELETTVVEDDYNLCQYCCYSGRLASLGKDTWLKRVPELFRHEPFKGRLDEIFQTFIRAEWQDCSCQEEEMLGVVITVAQDFHCFLKHLENPPFSSQTLGLVHEWENNINALELDAKAVDFLEDFRDTFPLPDEDCLRVVLAPISEEMLDGLREIYPASNAVYQSTKTAPHAWEVETDLGKMTFTLRGERGACSLLEAVDENQEPAPISLMRWGILPMVPDVENRKLWVADHAWIPTETPQQQKSITVKFWSGAKTVLQPVPLFSRQRSSFFGKIQAVRPVVMAAEGTGRASREFFQWKSEDGRWEIMGYVVGTEFRLVPMEGTSAVKSLRFLGQDVPRKDAEYFTIPAQTLFDLSETDVDFDVEVFGSDGQAVLLKYVPEEEE